MTAPIRVTVRPSALRLPLNVLPPAHPPSATLYAMPHARCPKCPSPAFPTPVPRFCFAPEYHFLVLFSSAILREGPAAPPPVRHAKLFRSPLFFSHQHLVQHPLSSFDDHSPSVIAVFSNFLYRSPIFSAFLPLMFLRTSPPPSILSPASPIYRHRPAPSISHSPSRFAPQFSPPRLPLHLSIGRAPVSRPDDDFPAHCLPRKETWSPLSFHGPPVPRPSPPLPTAPTSQVLANRSLPLLCGSPVSPQFDCVPLPPETQRFFPPSMSPPGPLFFP